MSHTRPDSNGQYPEPPRAVEDAQIFLRDDLKQHYDRMLSELAGLHVKAEAWGKTPSLHDMAELLEDFLYDMFDENINGAQRQAAQHGYEDEQPYTASLVKEARDARICRALARIAELKAAQNLREPVTNPATPISHYYQGGNGSAIPVRSE